MPAGVRRVWRITRTLLLGGIAVVAALGVSLVTIDLGPSIRARAEAEGSTRLDRPMHIGRLSIRLLTGRFVLDDVVIEGLTPESRPFLTAKRLDVGLPWWTLFRRELLLDTVEMRGWRMVIEAFPGGRHSFPRLPSPRPSGGGSSRFVTTLRYLRASEGHFSYLDHGTPWSTEAANLDIVITKSDRYRGQATFHDGRVSIQEFVPMWANMRASFTIDGSEVRFDRIDLETDGARSEVVGRVNVGRWPEQRYRVTSEVDLGRQRELFFAAEPFRVAGESRFSGTFSLFKGGHELQGTFASEEARVNDDYRFGRLQGSLAWTRDHFQVMRASSELLGGTARFDYAIRSQPDGAPSRARFDVAYEDVDLAAYTDLIELDGLRLAGRATGQNLLEYPLGQFSERRGGGHIQVSAPRGALRTAADARPLILDSGSPVPEGRVEGRPTRVPIAGTMAYRYSPEGVSVDRGQLATSSTDVGFSGRTAWGDDSSLVFHATSRDWQESSRLLAGVITATGRPTDPVDVGGRGTFEGTLTGALAHPRLEGRFRGDLVRAWDVVWGETTGEVVIDEGYAIVQRGRVRQEGATIDVDGRFSLGTPRADRGEEINARFQVAGRPVADLRQAFGVDDYALDGRLSGDFHLYGDYRAPFGYGRMTIARGAAWREPFDEVSAALRFEGKGVRLDDVALAKAQGGVTGAAYIGWDGTYAFNADARGIPLDTIERLQMPSVPLTGDLRFAASGSGTFESPRYVVRASIEDLAANGTAVGRATGQLTVRGDTLTVDQLEVASNQLAVSGAGRVALTARADGELSLRFTETAIDPYARVLFPTLSPETRVVASGTVRLAGAFADPRDLSGEATIERFDLSLLDYRVHNDGLLRLSLGRGMVNVDRLRLVGEGTALEMAGDVALDSGRVNLGLLGDANLGLLQGFARDVRSSGATVMQAVVRGSIDQPEIVGSAHVTNGRVRHFALPHAIEQLNGRIGFDARGVELDGLSGRFGGGPVRFGGRVELDGFTVSEYGLTASATAMRLRFPSSFRSVADAELALRGPASEPVLSGDVRVRDAQLVETLDTVGTGGLLGLTTGESPEPPLAPVAENGWPLVLDVRVEAPGSIRIENRDMRLSASADLTLSGTYDRPRLFGHSEVVRGEIFAEGRRYEVMRGVVNFSNPAKIEPFFDVEAETRAQVPGQVYRVILRASGTPERFVFDLTSDPPLAEVDILALLFGEMADPQDRELRALRDPNEAERDLIATRALRLLANPLSSEVGRAAEDALGVDTVQIAPALGDLSAETASRLDPGARLTIGKRLSDRVYLTYGRLLTSARRDQLILLEYNQSNRLSWVVSQNEDETYAVDVRMRHVF